MTSNLPLTLADRIASHQPCFIIAEAGVNHNGSLDLALQLVDVAVECGADAIKFQTFNAHKLVTADAPQADYQAANSGKKESQFEMLRRLELSIEDHRRIIQRCHQRGIQFMSTPFDEESVDLLADEGMQFFKIPSGEVTNLPLIQHIASKRRPVLLSTGMCNLADVEAAVETLEQAGISELALLHCVSNYPAAAADTNLRAMQTMATAFGYAVGYSDHTLGSAVPLAAVALGAKILEKHFTLDRSLPGPDHLASSEPAELSQLISDIRVVESALGNGRKRPAAAEASTAAVARRSLVAARPIRAGEIITRQDLVGRRPGTGLPPAMLEYLQNRRAVQDIAADEMVTLGMFA
ncbi:N-acetylneuraminate synthase [Planctomycetaceae bacterium SH139]